MAPAHLRSAVHRVRRTVLPPEASDTSDGPLLRSFIERNDGEAFAALVRRHGRMVLGVCRRVARNHHDAEDAFQATFLVLARRAASVNPREQLPNWLYGVAFRTASKARALAARRRAREARAALGRADEGVPPVERDDLRSVIDRELNALPAGYRLALLVCDLEGESVRDAAERLGWPQGTLAGRLARGRKLLARRLASRGVVVPAGTLAAALAADPVMACVPAALFASTVRAARTGAASPTPAAGAVSPAVATLTEGVMMTTFWHRMKAATALLILGAAGLAGGLLAHWPAAAARTAEPPAATATATATPTKPEPAARPGTAHLAYEVHILTVPEGTRFGPDREGAVEYLTQAQLNAAFKRVQGDRNTNVLQAPKVTTRDDEPTVMKVTDVSFYVTDVQIVKQNGRVLLNPVNTPIETGVTLTLTGRASADRESVTVGVNYTVTRVDKVELLPVTVTPEDPPPGAPVQYIQHPTINALEIARRDLKLSAGRHAVVAGPTSVQTSRDDRVPAELWEVPVVGPVLTAIATKRTTVRTYLIVSARVADEPAPAPRPGAK
ncbi:sigma-70 family rna polymerase sigma factor : RNA polymerase sigma factor, sigma-70 family OS=Singulisphaera acidiphila (strain ATCC BAA-1392 / DSM 18658 / VKM B-2454 / MOB10) GN=Sinac_7487 PE=4 SV=1: Sigma70_r2: Sigma70_r4_2: Secretin [Gemmataceae bacterium]|nr:sigma-70 family rna polymerase sigma factor : RNA polymerase sigma factor, sigma-70 family OS=Singulisphaera acidiphila (strain ATCC BAA-1392 / DSM 18658 / VKM B-2454 / MOB10) GN=Sinac_7487 PE=4 SV=1: Sigma70_r2: Sigma70_r4_2: Secretin [Gemmataceae bacterium]VTT97995.1 sigma-70 family rna polymerase sigma factor : RNA polymerase sigma factor, sigma-70 family OS=Singulisphaera acidiphila (strain ATCC BAA-1392 / DSM 18658 / VKM B-2454 / MOB10) GN=Sinac_7487 PE=4 SV=1: Sigma70_r2: Sigma70_r4_2: Se